MKRLKALPSSLRRRVARLPSWAVGLIGVLGVSVVVAGAVFGYRTYDYIEHDNEFCLSCHLMVEPYELFAQSAHRGLGCKACHMPTFAARSQMALTQILENPDTLSAHAEVPNEKCVSCHVEGDPDTWESVRNSAGHRIHFESDDPTLQGLNCVECHSTSLHEFTATSATCAQSGCHEDSSIQLGAMGDFTIHCTACHNFSQPVPADQTVAQLAAATRPDAESCLSCHAMRTLVDMPADEPHDQSCGACHDPHAQTTPAQAVESCATADCHSQPESSTPFHRGLGSGVLEECTACHGAHDWRAVGQDCLSCHQDVFQDGAGRATASVAPSPSPFGFAASARHLDPGPADAGALPPGHPTALSPPAQALDTTFVHAEHRTVDCTSCHVSEEVHGRITATSIRDCRACHHTAPVMDDCTACHSATSTPGDVFSLTRTMAFTVRDPVRRDLPFDHEPHDGLDCATCHTEGLALSAVDVDCSSCHEDHHTVESECMSCHVEAPEPAHTVDVHVGCSAAGCHTEIEADLDRIPRTRPFCLTCHQELVDHRPGQECEQCHELPAPLRGRGGRGGRP